MKRKMIAIIAVAVIAALGIAGGTLAYFTDQDTVTNVATTGAIDVQISEVYTAPEALMPGQTVDKVVTIKNLKDEAFIRVKVDLAWGTFDGETFTACELSTANITLNLADGWTKIGDYYYARADKATDLSFMSSYTFVAGDNDNDYAEHSATITITADGIQTAADAIVNVWGITYDAGTGAFAAK